MTLKILQINLGRGREAQDLIDHKASHDEVDIILISEQYRRMPNHNWYQDRLGKAAIYVKNQQIIVNKIEENNDNFVVVHIQGLRIYSCYFSPSIELADFQSKLTVLEENIKSANTPVLVGGDFNSKSPEWQSRCLDQRGIAVSEMTASLGLIVLNRGSSPTFRRGDSGTIIDNTMASVIVAEKILKWQVLEEETLSDHQYIFMSLNMDEASMEPTKTKRGILSNTFK